MEENLGFLTFVTRQSGSLPRLQEAVTRHAPQWEDVAKTCWSWLCSMWAVTWSRSHPHSGLCVLYLEWKTLE